MSAATLTRAQAHQLIDDLADDRDDLERLARHWIGNADLVVDSETPGDDLHDYIDECASGDEARSNGPKEGDDTGLTAP